MSCRLTHRRILEGLKLLFVAGVTCVLGIVAQERRISPQLPAPPPMHAVTHAERVELDDIKDPKARIRRTLEFAETHLQRAEALGVQQRYDQLLTELGMYLGLFDDGLQFLNSMNNTKGKQRDLYKRIELTLREAGPRLTGLRRNTPLEFAIRIKEVEEFARDGREEALNSFYGNTVVRDAQPKKPPEKTNENSNKPEREQ